MVVGLLRFVIIVLLFALANILTACAAIRLHCFAGKSQELTLPSVLEMCLALAAQSKYSPEFHQKRLEEQRKGTTQEMNYLINNISKSVFYPLALSKRSLIFEVFMEYILNGLLSVWCKAQQWKSYKRWLSILSFEFPRLRCAVEVWQY